MKAVQEESGGRVSLEVGSLYRVVNRMLDSGLIERTDPPPDTGDARRKHDYALTDLGREVVRAETERLAQVLATAQARDLAGR
jgi:DNA-binding PadR family transcriptional regulator